MYRIDAHASKALPGLEAEFNVFTDEARQRLGDIGDDLIEIGDAQGLRLLAAETQQLARQFSSAPGGQKNFVQLGFERAGTWSAVEREFGIAGDDGQKIVEVVSDASGEAADGIHLLRLAELRLEANAFGKIAPVGNEMSDAAFAIADGTDAGLHIVEFAVLFAIDQNAAEHVAGKDRLPHRLIKLRRLLARLQDARRLAASFGGAISGKRLKCRVHVFDDSVAIGDHDAVV